MPDDAVKANAVLDLSAVDENYFPTENLSRTGLFIRECYLRVCGVIVDDAEKSDKKYKVLVSGSPGIGKSAFLLLMLRYYLAQGESVLWAPRTLQGKIYDSVWLLCAHARFLSDRHVFVCGRVGAAHAGRPRWGDCDI